MILATIIIVSDYQAFRAFLQAHISSVQTDWNLARHQHQQEELPWLQAVARALPVRREDFFCSLTGKP